ncbi:MAG TPA: hypothetical protein PK156_30170 [Polyangium sp.]|nr:hypothetical protein [Polyangium sp.]
MQRHSEHRLRFGMAPSLDKPAPRAEFSALARTNQPLQRVNNVDAYTDLARGWISKAPLAAPPTPPPWIRKAPLGGSVEG